MNRWAYCLLPALVAACAGRGPAPELVPEPDPAPTALAPAETASLAIETPSPALPAVVSMADSVRDEEMLDRLREVTATGPDTIAIPEAAVAAMFDINVARYAEHDRVQFYLDFFKAQARERMAVWLARMPVYAPMARAAFAAKGLPTDLAYVALIESGYSNTAVSRSKAVGMWQFMRGTAKQYGLRVDQWVDDRRDPIKATAAAARFLSDLTVRFGGSPYLAAAAYNAGGGKVSRGLRKLGAGADGDYFDEESDDPEIASDPNGDDRFFHLFDSQYLRRETKDYVPKLIAAAMIAKQPEKYGFPPIPQVAPYDVDSVPVTEPTSLEVVAKAGGVPLDQITALNAHFVRQITPPGGLAWVRVPTGYGVAMTEALAAVPSAERVTSFSHPVGRRETVRSVAHRYGLSAAELADFNPGLSATSKLRPGTSLRIPGRARVKAIESQPVELAAKGRAGALHQVRRGETLGSIAKKYRVSVRQLLAWNDVAPGAKLKVGQRIRLGVRTGSAAAGRRTTRVAHARAVHVVRRGETLSALAKRYGVSVQALREANRLTSSRGLRAGVRLTIPS